jgi:UDP-N-acetylglucosamine acyltransferase
LKFEGEETTLEMGSGTIVREFCTLNRGTRAAGRTVIGKNCAFLTGSHVGHDCLLGDHVVLSNDTAIGGHAEIGSHVTMSALVLIHQFVRIGDYAFVAPRTTCIQDVVPFGLCASGRSRVHIAGINKVRLQRQDFSSDRRTRIRRMFRTLFREGLSAESALEKLESDFPADPDASKLTEFVRGSERGFYRMHTGASGED